MGALRQVGFLLLALLLSACGSGLCIEPLCFASPASLTLSSGSSADFGERTFSTNSDLVVTLRNAGETVASEMTGGSVDAPFQYKDGTYPGTGGTCGTTLAAGATCVVVFSFASPPSPQASFDSRFNVGYFNGISEVQFSVPILALSGNGAFIRASGLDAYAMGVAWNANRALLVGSFTSYYGTSAPYALQLLSDGSVDSSFSAATATGGLSKAVPAKDGSGDWYVAGFYSTFNGTSRVGIARMRSDGTSHSGFNSGVGLSAGGGVNAVAVAEDGSNTVYAGGSFSTYNGTARANLARIMPDGTLDTVFDVGAGLNNAAYALRPALDGTGDVFVGGSFTTYKGGGVRNFIRLSSTGNLVNNSVGTGFDQMPLNVAPETGGDLYVVGNFTTYNAGSSRGIIRLNSNLSVDGGFAVGTGTNGQTRAVALAADGSGKVYVAGAFTSYNGTAVGRIARLHSSGALDTTFQTGTGFDSWVNDIACPDDGTGDVLVSGYFTSYNGTPARYWVRLHADGSLAQGATSGEGFSGEVTALGLAENGSDLYGGGQFHRYSGTLSAGMVRITVSGARDSSFVVGQGFLHSSGSIFPPWALAATRDGSNRIYVAGNLVSYQGVLIGPGVARLNADGTLDTTFATGFGFNNEGNAVINAPDSSGDIYVGGAFTTYQGTISRNRIARLNSDGTIDSGFAVGTGFDMATVESLAAAEDGSQKIYAGGVFMNYNGTSRPWMARLGPTGALDTTFAPSFDFYVSEITLAADASGDIYVGGLFTSHGGTAVGGIARLNSDGSLDTAFAVGTGVNGIVGAILNAPDGSGDVYLGGGFSAYQGTTVSNLIRVHADGSLDTSFAYSNTFSSSVGSLVATNDGTGDIYVGGSFTAHQGIPMNFITRVDSTGVAD